MYIFFVVSKPNALKRAKAQKIKPTLSKNKKKILNCAYLYAFRLSNHQIMNLVGVAEVTYIILKKNFLKALMLNNEDSEKIGGSIIITNR